MYDVPLFQGSNVVYVSIDAFMVLPRYVGWKPPGQTYHYNLHCSFLPNHPQNNDKKTPWKRYIYVVN